MKSNMPPQRQGNPDDFQTPPEALYPLIPYIHPLKRVWEPACGKGNIVDTLRKRGQDIIGTDILNGPEFDFLSGNKPTHFDYIVTNPPFSLKDEFIKQCYNLGKAWALLLPITALGGQKRQNMYREHGVQILMLGKRVNFETPSGIGGGGMAGTRLVYLGHEPT